MKEIQILATLAKDREVLPIIEACLDIRKEFTSQAQVVYKVLKDYYERDPLQESADLQIVESELVRQNPKNEERFRAFVQRISGDRGSGDNISHDILETKVAKLQLDLGRKFINYVPYEKVKDEIQNLINISELGVNKRSLNTHEYEVYNGEDFLKLVGESGDRIPLFPSSLNNHLGGGIWRQGSIVVFGRPDVGKTTFIINLSCGFLSAGQEVLYLCNEDPISQILVRHVQCFLKCEKSVVELALEESINKCKEKGLDNLTLIETPSGTMRHLEDIIKDRSPDILIVDQLRNIKSAQENRVLQLEEVQRGIRELGKKYDCVSVSVTQAGATAEGKPYLDMGDVDHSRTGIAGACDAMIGIGATYDMLQNDERMISTPKNKLSGLKEPLLVKFYTDIVRVN